MMNSQDAANLLIRRHACAACFNEFYLESETDESTDDSDGNVTEILELYQLFRCQCPPPTRRMALVLGETEYRCFECLNAHRDQSASYEFSLSG